MEILETLYNELIGFLGITQVLELLKAGDYEAFKTYDGIVSLIIPIIPLLVILELILGLIYKNPQAKVYKVTSLFTSLIGLWADLLPLLWLPCVLGFSNIWLPFKPVLPGIGLFMVT